MFIDNASVETNFATIDSSASSIFGSTLWTAVRSGATVHRRRRSSGGGVRRTGSSKVHQLTVWIVAVPQQRERRTKRGIRIDLDVTERTVRPQALSLVLKVPAERPRRLQAHVVAQPALRVEARQTPSEVGTHGSSGGVDRNFDKLFVLAM